VPIDPNEWHLFTPVLSAISMSGLSPLGRHPTTESRYSARAMRQWHVLTVLVGLAAGLTTVMAHQSPDADVLVRATRQALGGEATLSGVTSFVLTGSLSRSVGGATSTSDLEIDCVLPDKFVRIEKNWMMAGPMGNARVSTYEGFNGDEPIHETVAPDAPIPPVLHSGAQPMTPAAVAAQRTAMATAAKRAFARWSVPLFVAAFSGYPTQFSVGGPFAPPSSRAVDALQVQGADGFHWVLFVEATTHLPARLTWLAKPIVTMHMSSMVAVDSSGRVRGASPPSLPPPGDPTAALAPVEWQLEFSDFQTADRVTWPRRLRTSYGGTAFEDVKISKVRINPSINPRVFRPSK
jgi:hypothetical protein